MTGVSRNVCQSPKVDPLTACRAGVIFRVPSTFHTQGPIGPCRQIASRCAAIAISADPLFTPRFWTDRDPDACRWLRQYSLAMKSSCAGNRVSTSTPCSVTTTSSLDAGGREPVCRRAVGLQRKHHPRLDLDRVGKAVEPGDDRTLVQAQPEPVAELQAEGCVPLQKSIWRGDLRFPGKGQAASRYSLIRPPSTA